MQRETGSPSRLLAHVNIVFFSQVASYGLAFALRAMLAQGLGEEGLGTYSLFYVSVLVAGGILSLGVGWANVYYLNKGPYQPSTLFFSSALVWALGVGLVVVGALTHYWLRGAGAFVGGKAYWLYVPAVPTVVAYLFLTSFLQGQRRFGALAGVAVSQGLAAVTASAALWAIDELTVGRILGAWIASFAMADVVTLFLLAPHRWRWEGVVGALLFALKDQIRYGVQSQLGNLAQFLNYRLDHYLVAAFVSKGAVGQYTVAVGLSESLWWISSAVVVVLSPRLSGMKREEAGELALAAGRNVLMVMGVAALGLAFLSPWAIRLLFGREFLNAHRPLIILLPGGVAAGVSMVLGSYLFSQGRAILNTVSICIALVATIILDLLLIPWLEVEGAALSSTLAYVLGLMCNIVWYRVVSGRPGWHILAVGRRDLRLYRDLWRAIWGRFLAQPQEE